LAKPIVQASCSFTEQSMPVMSEIMSMQKPQI